jgi:Twin arginine targeting (Tat) protein translocase TatC
LQSLKFKRKKSLAHPDEMSFVDHLEVLRWHIVRSLIAVVVVSIVLFIRIDWLFDNIIYGPMRADFASYVKLCSFSRTIFNSDALCMPPPEVNMQVTAFGSQFISSITIALVGGIIVAFPYIVWELWRFIKPALNAKELSYARGSIFWVTFFFLLGVLFAYFLLAPFTFSFLSNYKLGSLHALETRPTLDDYIENMMNIVLGTGLAFELPVFTYVLAKIGLVSARFMKNYRKYAYVGILLIAAVITPSPDWMSQLIVSLPLFSLYEISILVAKKVEHNNLKEEKAFFGS